MAEEEIDMTSRTRFIVLSISAPVIAFAIVGGFLGRVMANGGPYPAFKMFDDVTEAITSSYVEQVNVDKVMDGAMRGLADGLDADSAFLSPDEVREAEAAVPLAAGDVGIELTRQYYLRVIAARDGSPAAKAGLHTGDYVRMIDDKPTRDMSVWEGVRALRGAPGTKVKLTIIRGNAVDPHVVELTREVPAGADVTAKMAAAGVGYVRVAALGTKTADQVKARIAELTKSGATRLIVDIRRNSSGRFEDGLSLARLFIASGTLAERESRGPSGNAIETVAAQTGDGAITLPVDVLIDTGTSGPAELFAAAMAGNRRADLIGEHTIGRAATQKLVKLPDGSGLWLSTSRYLTPAGAALHEKGLEPTVAVDEPDVDFGQPEPTTDPILEKALERAGSRKAA
jgi:carboxyl-terminal processing protease